MALLNWVLSIIVLALGVPIGLLISWNSRDELVGARKFFIALVVLSIGGGLWFWLVGMYEISLTFAFILIVVLTSLVKSKDASWVKKRRV